MGPRSCRKMPYEIEYKLSGGNPHLYRLGQEYLESKQPVRYETCKGAVEALAAFVRSLPDDEKQHGMELKIIWVD
jgi:hypothetical protein